MKYLANPVVDLKNGIIQTENKVLRSLFIAGTTGLGIYFLKKTTEQFINQELKRNIFSFLPEHMDKIVSIPLSILAIYFTAKSVKENKNAAIVGGTIGALFHEINYAKSKRNTRAIAIINGKFYHMGKQIDTKKLQEIISKIKLENSRLVVIIDKSNSGNMCQDMENIFSKNCIRGEIILTDEQDQSMMGSLFRDIKNEILIRESL